MSIPSEVAPRVPTNVSLARPSGDDLNLDRGGIRSADGSQHPQASLENTPDQNPLIVRDSGEPPRIVTGVASGPTSPRAPEVNIRSPVQSARGPSVNYPLPPQPESNNQDDERAIAALDVPLSDRHVDYLSPQLENPTSPSNNVVLDNETIRAPSSVQVQVALERDYPESDRVPNQFQRICLKLIKPSPIYNKPFLPTISFFVICLTFSLSIYFGIKKEEGSGGGGTSSDFTGSSSSSTSEEKGYEMNKNDYTPGEALSIFRLDGVDFSYIVFGYWADLFFEILISLICFIVKDVPARRYDMRFIYWGIVPTVTKVISVLFLTVDVFGLVSSDTSPKSVGGSKMSRYTFWLLLIPPIFKFKADYYYSNTTVLNGCFNLLTSIAEMICLIHYSFGNKVTYLTGINVFRYYLLVVLIIVALPLLCFVLGLCSQVCQTRSLKTVGMFLLSLFMLVSLALEVIMGVMGAEFIANLNQVQKEVNDGQFPEIFSLMKMNNLIGPGRQE